MRTALLISIFIFLLNNAFTQQPFTSKFTVDTKFQDTFSFAKTWAYHWETWKGKDGKFSNPLSGKLKITPKDTMHLFYTADCSTNVQGGYKIRYCNAINEGNEMVLQFTDGLPAYASQYRVHIKNDSFYFEPQTIYPASSRGEKKTYRVNKEKLVLNKNNFNPGEMVKGYVEFDFTEQIELPGKPVQENNYYLKGFFNTALPLRNSDLVGLEEKFFINDKGKKQRYSDPADLKRKWYNYSEMRLKGDSVFLDQMSIAIYKNDTAWSASDGGFFYHKGTWTQNGSSVIFYFTEMYCDYCLLRPGAAKRGKLWQGRITDQGILIEGYLFRFTKHAQPLDSERGLPH